MLAIPFRARLAGPVAIDQRTGPDEPSADDSIALVGLGRDAIARRHSMSGGRGGADCGEGEKGGTMHARNPLTPSPPSDPM